MVYPLIPLTQYLRLFTASLCPLQRHRPTTQYSCHLKLKTSAINMNMAQAMFTTRE